METRGSRLILVVLLVFLALAAVLLLNLDDEPYSYLRARAAKLDHDPDKIRAFVRDEVVLDTYAGQLRGPLGTLWAGAGNRVDKLALERALFRVSGLDFTEPPSESPAPHLLEVAVVNHHADGTRSRAAKTFKTHVLVGTIIVLEYTRDGSTRLMVDGVSAFKLTGPASGVQEQVLEFTHTTPGGKGTTYRRQIFTRKYPEYETMFDPRNRHVIVVTTGSVPEWVFRKETELLGGERKALVPEDVRAGYLLALSHIWQSDKNTPSLADHFKVKATFAEPRVIIASTWYRAGGQTAAVVRGLDLRRNRLSVSGDAAAGRALTLTRSIIEGALEGTVLSAAIEAEVLTAMKVLERARQLEPRSVRERLEFYVTAIEKLAGEMRPGSHITFLGSEADQKLSLVLEKDRKVRIAEITPSLRTAIEDSGIQFEVLAGEFIERPQIGLAGLELEVLFGAALKSDTDYRPDIVVSESKEALIFENARIFSRRKKDNFVTLEYQFLSTKGDVRYESIDYYDEINRRSYVKRGSYRIPAKNTESSDVFSWWYSQRHYDKGSNFLYFSRKMYRELKEKGETTYRYMKRDCSLSDPIKLFVIKREKMTITVNNRLVELPVLRLAGDFVKNNPVKKAERDDYEKRYEAPERKSWVMNRNTILDNPDFPLVMNSNMAFQSDIPGKVISKTTGRGIPGAKVTVLKVSAKTWGDGTLLLPVIDKQFAIFTVRAERSGYKLFSEKIDFSKPDSFPLKIEMEPVPVLDLYAWITRDNLDKELARLKTTDRVKDLIRGTFDERPAAAVFTTIYRVPFGSGTAHAWTIYDQESGEMIGVTEDGLYASSALGGFMKDHASNTLGSFFGQGSPYELQTGTINYFAGFIASWYTYSAGKLDALALMMDGQEFKDMGHAHAMKFARDWLAGMSPAMSSLAGQAAGVRGEQFKAGFEAGLAYFEAHPEYQGR